MLQQNKLQVFFSVARSYEVRGERTLEQRKMSICLLLQEELEKQLTIQGIRYNKKSFLFPVGLFFSGTPQAPFARSLSFTFATFPFFTEETANH